jgi:hypothetical protein
MVPEVVDEHGLGGSPSQRESTEFLKQLGVVLEG